MTATTDRMLKIAVAAVLLAGLVVLPAPAGEAGTALDRFKALQGTWEGTNSKGEEVRVRYEVVAGGSAVMEHLQMKDHPDMVTMYHRDGDELILTHYCGAGNQPRMTARRASGDEIRFEFKDATNLASAAEGHMHRAVFRFDGEDGLSSAWTWNEAGEDRFTETITVRRVSASAAR